MIPPGQVFWLAPALAVAPWLLVNTTSSSVAVHGLLEMVHLRVALVPAGTPVTPEVGEPGVVTVAVPLVTDQAPVPIVAVLPARVKLPLSHLVWSAPAFATVGFLLNVTSTSSVDAVQGAFEIVQRKV
jgi:hypothetical protein